MNLRNLFTVRPKRAAALAHAVRPVIEMLEDRVLLTSVTSVTPGSSAFGVAPDAHIVLSFNTTLTSSTLSSTNIELLDSNNNVVPTRISYNATGPTVTLDATSELTYDAQYTVFARGGSTGVKDSSGNTMTANFSSSFTVAPNPVSGPGGPILIVTNTTDQFSSYYAEILKAEGLNEFSTVDIGSINSTILNSYQLVLLGETSLTGAQTTLLTNYVNSGGKLIAMRPDAQLSGLLGITPTGQSAAEEYLQVDNSTTVGAGIVDTTLQYHGTADLYALNGATALATIYSDATTATVNPAVTMQSVGTSGGQAAAFTFDLAQSIVDTRQGNPAWAGEHRDGQTVTRADDQFFGDYSADPEPNYVDLNKVAIPQADEQQRLLSNMIEQMLLPTAPTPRFWYFPNGAKAVIVMTGDDHDTGGTTGRWNQFLADGTSGGLPITGTSYLFPGVNNTNAALAPYITEGFEAGLHLEVTQGALFGSPSDVAVDYTSLSELESLLTSELATFDATYPSLPSPVTNRTHAIVWSDYASTPEAEFASGIRMDLNYYYWPASWINDHPGFFTGSGIPMRFATATGQTIDVYQQVTDLTDESGQSFPYEINALLAAATGPEGFYGAFGVNAHTDDADSTVSNAIVAAAQQYNVPVISAEDMLDFQDEHDNSSFTSTTWNSSTNVLTFGISLASGNSDLTAMVPLVAGNNTNVSSITINGKAVSFTRTDVAGIYYAMFNAAAGAVSVQYSAGATRLAVTSVSPTSGASNVAINSSLTAVFNTAIDSSSLNFTLTDNNGQTVAATVSYNASTLTATLKPTEVLRSGVKYTITINALDSSENPMSPIARTFTTAPVVVTAGTTYSVWSNSTAPSVPDSTDTTALELGMQFSSDADGYVTGVRFYKGTTNTGTHDGNLWTADGTLLASGTFSGESASGWQTLTFATPVLIDADQIYVVSYGAPNGGYADTSGFFNTTGVDNGPLHALSNGMTPGGNGVFADGTGNFPNMTNAGDNYWVDVMFTPLVATNGPAVIAETPANGAVGVTIHTDLTATFNENILASTLAFVLKDSNNNAVAATVSYSSINDTATLTPVSPLTTGMTYTVTISGAQDAAGNTISAPFTWSFGTESTDTYSLWPSTAVPTVTDAADPASVELGVKFQSSVAGTITGIRFYKGVQNTGTHTGSLWSSTGTLLATGTFTNETASGWQTLVFSSPITISANTTYVASYHTTTGFYADDAFYFDNDALTTGPLTALSDIASGGNGVYLYGASAFPTQSYNASNYWVDVTFVPGAAAPTSPTVIGVSPTSGATSVSTSPTITLTFNEALNASTVNSTTVQLLSGSTVVAATVSYTAGSNTVTITPAAVLNNSATYTISVLGGASGVKDAGGNVMSGNFTSSFTTIAVSTGVDSIWGDGTLPTTADVDDPNSVELGVKFESSTSGTITGIRFYKGAENTGAHTGSLWTSTGTLLATGTFTNETASGWQTLVFATPVAISANTVYVASYHTSTGFYAVNNEYFQSNGVTNGPLTALSNTAAGGNGLYLYGSGFPTNTYQSDNYWVDVTFIPGTTTPTAPSVVSVSPTAGATGVSASSVMTLTFNEALNASTVTSTTVQLLNGATAVAAAVSYNSTSFVIMITPTAALAAGTTYTISALGGASGIAASNGATLATTFTSSFTTAASLIAPTITAETPVSGSTGLAVSVLPNVTFSEAMNAASFTSSTVKLLSGTTAVATTLSYNASTNVLTITPTAVLAANTTYTLTIAGGSSGVSASNGAVLATSVSSTFTTAAAATAPTITSHIPASSATNVAVNAAPTVAFSEAMNPASFTSSTVKLLKGTTAVAATLSYNASTNVLTITPTAALANGTTYTITIVGGSSGVSASNGANLAATSSWTFTTIAAPAISSHTPASNATNVSRSVAIAVTFNQAMNASSFTSSTVTLISGTTVIAATLSYNATTNVLTITPKSKLAASTRYTVTIVGGTGGVTSAGGTALAASTSWSFTTGKN